ncbi:MAG: LPXTG cell wall anchor domain-containing protein [Bacilli bacterium]|nr:LPXTG cell wall anchor domain-containing protein [Bacilli bacterium]
MNKLFKCLSTAVLGIAMALGVGVGIAFNKGVDEVGADISYKEAYTITYTKGSSDSGTTAPSIENGGDYATLSHNNYAYARTNGMHLSSGNNAGNATLTMKDSGKVVAKRIVTNALAKSNKSFSIQITYSDNSTETQTFTPGTTTTDCTFDLTNENNLKITSIYYSAIKGSGAGIASTKVFVENQSTEPSIEITNNTPQNTVVGQIISLTAKAINYTDTPSEILWEYPTDKLEITEAGQTTEGTITTKFKLLVSGEVIINAYTGEYEVISDDFILTVSDVSVNSIDVAFNDGENSYDEDESFTFKGKVVATLNNGETEEVYSTGRFGNLSFKIFSSSTGGTEVASLIVGTTKMNKDWNGYYLETSYSGKSKRKQIIVNASYSIDTITENNGIKNGLIVNETEGAYLEVTKYSCKIGTPTITATSSDTTILTTNVNEMKIFLTPKAIGDCIVTINLLSNNIVKASTTKNIRVTRKSAETEVTFDFTQIDGFSSWGSSYSSHDVSYDEGKINFSSASKQTGTITDMPVGKACNVTFTLSDELIESKYIYAAELTCKQWVSKTQTIQLFTKGEEEQKVTETSKDFVLGSSNFSEDIYSVIFKTTNTSNQIGFASLILDIRDKSTKEIVDSRITAGTVSAQTGDTKWTLEGFKFEVQYEGETDWNEVNANYTVSKEIPEFTQSGTIDVTVTGEYKGVSKTTGTIKATLTFINPYSIKGVFDMPSGSAITVDGIYTALAANGCMIICDGEYGFLIYDSSTLASNYEIGDYVTVSGNLNIYNGLYETNKTPTPTISKLTDSGRISKLSTPIKYVVTGNEGKGIESQKLANRLTSITGVITAMSSSTVGSRSNLTISVNSKSIIVTVVGTDMTAENIAAFQASLNNETEIIIEGVSTYYDTGKGGANDVGFEVEFGHIVVPVEDYKAENFAHDLLTLTDEVCAGYDGVSSKKDELALVWNVLNSDQHWTKMVASERIRFTSGEGETSLESARARYDYIVAKYGLGDFAGRNPSPNSGVNPLVSLNNIQDTTWILVIVGLVGLTAVGGYFFIRRRKEN